MELTIGWQPVMTLYQVEDTLDETYQDTQPTNTCGMTHVLRQCQFGQKAICVRLSV